MITLSLQNKSELQYFIDLSTLAAPPPAAIRGHTCFLISMYTYKFN